MNEQRSRTQRGKTQSFFVLDYTKSKENLIFIISGSTAKVYTVCIDNVGVGKCNCPDNKFAEVVFCKHLCFLWIRVFHQKETDIPNLFNLSQMNIHKSIRNDDYRKQYKTLTKKAKIDPSLSPLESKNDCMICFQNFENNSRYVRCETCSQIVHHDCMQKWLRYNHGTRSGCIYCRNTKIALSFQHNNDTGDYLQLTV